MVYAESDKMYDDIVAKIRTTVKTEPKIGIICGSGLGGITDVLTNTTTFNYKDLPGWPEVTVKGHAGELVFGTMHGNVDVVCMKGRFHGYEGHEYSKLGLGARVMKLLGAEVVVVTNAAGGVNCKFNVGDIMVMNDHVSFPCMSGINPLVGMNNERFGTRFPPMSDAYDEDLINHMHNCAADLGISKLMQEGLYCQVSGPNYESRGEIRLCRLLEIDAVGMSTVPEVIVARHCGLKVLGLSMITNKAILPGDDLPPANHKEVIEVVDMRTKDVQNLVALFCKDVIKVSNGEKKPAKVARKTNSTFPSILLPIGVLAVAAAVGIWKTAM
jgi:purine-nucleoside phosphorylase